MNRFEIDKDDITLMKTIMFAPCHSKYEVAEAANIPYATLLRKMEKLRGYEMITRLSEKDVKKNGTPDKRGPQTWNTTLKGLTYLIVNNHLKDADLRKALSRLYNSRKELQGLRRYLRVTEYESVWLPGMIEAILGLRPKINFLCFDEKYVIDLLCSVAKQAFFKRVGKMQPHTAEEMAKLVRESGKKQVLQWLKAQLKDARLEEKAIKNAIDALRKAVKCVRDI